MLIPKVLPIDECSVELSGELREGYESINVYYITNLY